MNFKILYLLSLLFCVNSSSAQKLKSTTDEPSEENETLLGTWEFVRLEQRNRGHFDRRKFVPRTGFAPSIYRFLNDSVYTSTTKIIFRGMRHVAPPLEVIGNYIHRTDSLIFYTIINQRNGELLSDEAFKIYCLDSCTLILTTDSTGVYNEHGAYDKYERIQDDPLPKELLTVVNKILPKWVTWIDGNSVLVKRDSIPNAKISYVRREPNYFFDYSEAIFELIIEPKWDASRIDSIAKINASVLKEMHSLEETRPHGFKSKSDYSTFYARKEEIMSRYLNEPITHIDSVTVCISQVRAVRFMSVSYYLDAEDADVHQDQNRLIDVLKTKFPID